MTDKMDRDFVAADLAAVEALLGRMTEGDTLTEMSLRSRQSQLQETLASLGDNPETGASAALFFSGKPVVSSRGIESEFGTNAINKFQDIVTKVFALRYSGGLGQRGTVPGKDLSRLHITNVVHGSFGFRLESLAPHPDGLESTLKRAVDEVSLLMDSFGEADDERFETAVEKLDDRVLMTIREFFELLRDHEAAFRLISNQFDKNFDRQTVERAAERARITRLREDTLTFDGSLTGAFPRAGQFEYVTETEREVIHGKISTDFQGSELASLNRDWTDKNSHVTVNVRRVVRGDRVVRETFTLLKIESR